LGGGGVRGLLRRRFSMLSSLHAIGRAHPLFGCNLHMAYREPGMLYTATTPPPPGPSFSANIQKKKTTNKKKEMRNIVLFEDGHIEPPNVMFTFHLASNQGHYAVAEP